MHCEDVGQWGLVRALIAGFGAELEFVQVIVQLGMFLFEELAENGHVNSQRVHRVGEIAFWQDVVYQVDHAHESLFFLFVHNFEYERGYDVKALAVADGFVVAGESEKDSFEQSSVALVLVPAECATAGTMKILDNLYAQLVVVWIGAIVEGHALHFVPVDFQVFDVVLGQV